jgi:hypothetical protein
MLRRIAVRDVEALGDFEIAIAPRLTLLTGDNGLGKTFALELAWWVATAGEWAGHAAMPARRADVTPRIDWEEQFGARRSETLAAGYDFDRQHWKIEWTPYTQHLAEQHGRQTLVLYSTADGTVHVWDPYRESGPFRVPLGRPKLGFSNRFTLTPEAIWNGLGASDGTVLCNGFIRDVVTWQFQKPSLFDLFVKVLARLSPRADEVLRPGPPQRVSVDDVRDIPTIELPYGRVPVTHASAGIRRVLALAYVLVWAWNEHREAAALRNKPLIDELLFLFDEVDAHLHPRWQRVILPALFEVVREVDASLKVQLIASTHAPLVLASAEPIFDSARDALVHFTLRDGRVVVEEIPWAKQGDAANWLVSETFGLHQARSRDAEWAIEMAEAFMRGEATPAPFDTVEALHAELVRTVPGHDRFWPRWLVRTGVVT